MTAKLLPVFLQSFTDSYVSIRIEACISSGNLGVQDASILDKLVHLATYDPIWKVKALAIQGRYSFRIEFTKYLKGICLLVRYGGVAARGQ